MSPGDEGMCVNTHQATGKIPAQSTAGDIAEGNYIIVRMNGVHTVSNGCKKNQELRDHMPVNTMSSYFTFPAIGLVRSNGERWSTSIVAMIQQVNMELSWKSGRVQVQVLETCTCARPDFLYRRP